MFASYIFTACLVASPLVTAFQFTAPERGATLNLSSPIEITWTSDNEQYSEVDLQFKGPDASGGGFGYTIAENISISDGAFTWQPMNVSEALQSTNISLTTGDEYTFEARLHNGDAAGMGLDTERFSVTGYPLMGAAASLQPRVGAALLAMVFMSMAFVL
jgi:hypothetical protein